MHADFWTHERIATLKRLWAEGKPASEIAQKLGGISRSAVLGKIFRLRLGAAAKPAGKSRQKAKANCANRKPRQTAPKDRPTRRRGGQQATKAQAPASTHKSLLELTNHACRWPQGRPGTKNFFFCGASGADLENGLPYCAQHMRRAYVVPPDKAGATPLAPGITPWRVISRAA
jgi:GcrA cell cycle regulator